MHYINMGFASMTGNGVEEKIGKLAKILVLTESSGLQTLASMQKWFEEISQWTVEKPQADISLLSMAASKVIEQIILEKIFYATAEDLNNNQGDGAQSVCESEGYTEENIRQQIRNELLIMGAVFSETEGLADDVDNLEAGYQLIN